MNDMERFKEFARGKSFALIGAGVSNLPLVSFLFKAGAESVSVRDLRKSPESPEALTAHRDGADLYLGENYLEDLREDVILRSPGIRPDKDEFIIAEKKGSFVTCETELFLEYCSAKTFGITGSDGKTTTTTLIAKILEESGKKVILGGNIGRSMLPRLAETDGENVFVVMELSSFQLMNGKHSPTVSVITNLSENHLDWHHGMREYLEAKKNILRFQNKNGLAVLNGDNAYTRALSGNGTTRYFSYENTGERKSSVFFRDGKILIDRGEQAETFLDTAVIQLPGRHNVENFMAAIAATLEDAAKDAVFAVASTFTGVEHRMEKVRVKDGVTYYNSSIDSSPSRTTAALNTFREKVIMIAGGKDKKLDYSALGDVICKHVKALILCGETADKIESSVTGSALYQIGAPEIIQCRDLNQCVIMAEKISSSGDTVILTPASTSFDQFKNFEERGNAFKRMVMEL